MQLDVLEILLECMQEDIQHYLLNLGPLILVYRRSVMFAIQDKTCRKLLGVQIFSDLLETSEVRFLIQVTI